MPVSPPRVPLSVLELAPVGAGSTPADALGESRLLARQAESLGFTRFLAAEHHNAPNAIASTSPAIVAAAIGQATTRLRVGTGGILLPNHSTLVVAEQLATLAALFPGRVDFGIGRAAAGIGGAPAASFPQQVDDLIGLLSGRSIGGLRSAPAYSGTPGLWILGSSPNGATLAGRLGFPFAYGHHLMPERTAEVIACYRREFRPSAVLARPYAAVAVEAICGADDKHGAYLGSPFALLYLAMLSGRQPEFLPTCEEAAAYPWSPQEAQARDQMLAGQAVGGPDTVRARLSEILESTGADELILATLVPDGPETRASVDRVRGLFGDAELPLGLAL